MTATFRGGGHFFRIERENQMRFLKKMGREYLFSQ